jgi:mannosyltransferase OCH1-like enzyme
MNFIPISNSYKIYDNNDNHSFVDYTLNIYYISSNECKIIVRRHDQEYGWGFLSIQIDNNEIIDIGSSLTNSKIIDKVTTKTNLIPISFSSQQIPKIIIQTNECLEKSNANYSVIESNPEYEYKFFNAIERRNFIKLNYNFVTLEAYDLLVSGAYKADLFRYLYLYKYGGCYLDSKIIQRKPFREIIKENDTFIVCNDYTRDNSLSNIVGTSYLNSVIISIANNELLKELICKCIENILIHQQYYLNDINYNGYKNILDITGPTLMYKVLREKINIEEMVRMKHIIKDNKEDNYYNFQIVDLKSKDILFHKTNKFVKNINHYSELWMKKEIFYKNYQKVNDDYDNSYIFLIYPSQENQQFSDTFSFKITDNEKEKIVKIKRIDIDENWWINLHIIVINDNTSINKEFFIDRNIKTFNLDF